MDLPPDAANLHRDAPVWSNAELRDAGQSAHTVANAARAGALQRVRQGRYAAGRSVRGRVAEHLLLTIDLAAEVGPGAVVSHASAAVLWGLDVPDGLDLSSVHLTWPGAAGRGTSTNIHPHRAWLDPEDRLEVHGLHGSISILVTTPARTVYDLARSQDQMLAVPVADAMFREALCSRDDFAEVLERARGRPGSVIAREVMHFADGRSAGDLQSRTRVLLARLGIPRPGIAVVLTHPVYGDIGPLDFELPGLRTVLCCDSGAVGGRCPARDLLTDTVRETGRQVLWVGEPDLRSGDHLLDLLHSSLRAAGAEGRRRQAPVLSARTRS